jgi:hypothetical protein
MLQQCYSICLGLFVSFQCLSLNTSPSGGSAFMRFFFGLLKLKREPFVGGFVPSYFRIPNKFDGSQSTCSQTDLHEFGGVLSFSVIRVRKAAVRQTAWTR